MINKRLLVKNLLTHSEESTFYDKKQQLNLHTKEGKGKFLKHICALSNSNPDNNSYLVVGVDDHTNTLIGVDFYDDSRIQNLINAYLDNPPLIQYENISFPSLPEDKVIGLVSIQPKVGICRFKKSIYTYDEKFAFQRIGSSSTPLHTFDKLIHYPQASSIVQSLESASKNNIQHTLDAVFDFIHNRHADMKAQYVVFKEAHVICWAGIPKLIDNKTLFSRVDIELITEQIKLFYSAYDLVEVTQTEDLFTLTEYIPIGVNEKTHIYPLEKVNIEFFDNGSYQIQREFLFEPPQFDQRVLHHIYNHSVNLLRLLKNNPFSSKLDQKELEKLPNTLLLCYYNGFLQAKEQLIVHKEAFKKHPNPSIYGAFKESLRILRKIKYDPD